MNLAEHSEHSWKVCLIRPPAELNVNAINRFSVPPIGLAYIASAVREAGFAVQVVDAIGDGLTQYTSRDGDDSVLLYGLKFQEILKRIDPRTRVIGLSILFSREWLLCRSLIEEISAAFPQATIIIGGEHATACAEYSLRDAPAVTAAVLGEGEETVTDLLKALQNGKPLGDVSGICYRDGNTILRTPARKRIRAVDAIAPPAWDLFPLEKYIEGGHGLGFDIGRSAPMLATRGCPFRCTFCSNTGMWGPSWVSRSPRTVVDEMKNHIALYNVTNFDFYDLTAIIKKEWLVEFCNLIIEENLDITIQLPSGTRSEALDKESLSLLYKAGCRSIIYAPESGSPQEIKRIKKNVHIGRMLRSMKASSGAGIRTKANIIFGMPGATWRDVAHTMWFIVRMSFAGVNDVGCFSFSPYPGSAMHDDLIADKKLVLDDAYFERLNRFNNVVNTESFNDTFSARQIGIFNVVGMALFYSTNFLFRPWRALEFVNILMGRKATSALGRSLSNFRRRQKARRTLRASETATICVDS